MSDSENIPRIKEDKTTIFLDEPEIEITADMSIDLSGDVTSSADQDSENKNFESIFERDSTPKKRKCDDKVVVKCYDFEYLTSENVLAVSASRKISRKSGINLKNDCVPSSTTF